MVDQESLSSLLDLAKDAALNAGNFLYRNRDKQKAVHSEIGRDIKLEIDRETELLIRKKLQVSEIQVLGEEYGGDKKNESLQWIIDPLDGTSNYFRGIDKSCVSIGLQSDSEILLGVIYDFNCDEMYYSSKNNGAFCNEKTISVSKISEKSKASLTTGFPASTSVNDSIEFLEDLYSCKKIRMFGSAALSCAYVASGKCDCYLEKGVYIWDIAAGISIVHEAGGDVNYSKIDSDKYAVKFSNGLI